MKYATEMGSGAMIYMPSLIKIGSGIKKLMGGGNTHTDTQMHRQDGESISQLSFVFQNKESRLKNEALKVMLQQV
jgi:hypothetical protein